MAVMTAGERAIVSTTFQRDASAERQTIAGLTKAELLAAINALDDYLNTNQNAINLAIPQPARSALTTAQKAQLLVYVVRRRYEVGA